MTLKLRPEADVALLIERLSMIDPFALDTHPVGQIGHCERAARHVIAAPGMGLQPHQATSVANAYADGVKDGFYGLDATLIREGVDAQIGAGELTTIAHVGLRHGRLLRKWWSEYREDLPWAFSRDRLPR